MKLSRLRVPLLPLALVAVVTVVGPAIAANPEDVQRARETGSCKGCDLIEANLGGLQGEKGDFSGAVMTDASLYGANLTGANLTGAVLDGANLKAANLSGAQGVVLGSAVTDERTTCADGAAGPCE